MSPLNSGSQPWSVLQWIAFATISLTLVASSTAQETSTSVPHRLTFVGEVSQKGGLPGPTYLWNDGKVFVSSYRGTWRWARGPAIQVIDAHDGRELQKREIKVPCSGDHTFTGYQAIPNSTDVLVEGGCGHLLLLDGTTLETKRELTATVPRGEKLWSSSFVVSPDGKRVALAIIYETKKASRQVLNILRTSDWQEEGSRQIGEAKGGNWHSTFALGLFSADGQRLVGWWGHGLRILRLPSGEHESDIDIHRGKPRGEEARGTTPEGFLSEFSLEPVAPETDNLIRAVVPTNPDEILLIDNESGKLWTIHLKDGARERQAQLEDWPQLKRNYRGDVSSDGSWVCAPTSDPVRENAPAFAVWSTITGKVLATGDVLSFSTEEKRSAQLLDDTLSILMQGIHSECQVAPDGKYVMLRVEFGKLAARSRIYQVVFND